METDRRREDHAVELLRETNLYAYAFTDPVNWRDANGLWGIPGGVFGLAVGAITGGASTAMGGGDAMDVAVGAAIGRLTGAAIRAVNPVALGAGMLRAARLGALGSLLGQQIANFRSGRSSWCISIGNIATAAAGPAIGAGMAGVMTEGAVKTGLTQMAPKLSRFPEAIGMAPAAVGGAMGLTVGRSSRK